MGYIYKVINKVNNKVYIGMTSLYYTERWNSHKNRSFNQNTPDYNCHFHRAIRKYGLENFDWEVIEICDNSLLCEREKYWIKFYDSFNTGYNMTLGGEGNCLYFDEQIIELWNQGKGIKEICEELKIYKETVSYRLKSNGITEEEILNRGYQKRSKFNSTPVYQYSLDGDYICEYQSAAEVYNKLKIKNISECCRNLCKTAGGYRWSYQKTDKLLPLQKQVSCGVKKPVAQYNKELNLICTYDSAADAARAINGDKSHISQCCRGQAKTAYGYIWKYL